MDRLFGLIFIAALAAIGGKLVLAPELGTTQYGTINFGQHHSIVGAVIIAVDLYMVYLFYKSYINRSQ